MDARKDIESRIGRERQKITELQKQIESTESFIRGLQEALKILPRDGTIRSSRRSMTIRQGSDVAKIRDLIRKNGGPMHIGELVTGIGRQDTKANRMSLSGSLGRYVRRNSVFCRTGPNQFSLIDMEGNSATRLPPDFGTEEIPSDQPNEDDF